MRFSVDIPEGFTLEAIPLFGGRGRVIVTDGCGIRDVW